MAHKIKILAIASEGGHLVQLLRLDALFEQYESVLVTTNDKTKQPAFFNSLCFTVDINQNSNLLSKFKSAMSAFKVLFKHKPDVIISTGALPGLVYVVIGKVIFRRKTIWVDSIANGDELSKSGKVAKKFCDIWLTQWPHLSGTQGPEFIGSVI